MIYLTAFWTVVLLFAAIYTMASILKWQAIKTFLDDNGILFIMAIVSMLVIAIITDDPVQFAGITIPTELQWLGSLLISGFGTWKFYLNPLKSKVYDMDRELGEIKTSVVNVERGLDKITDKLLNGKGKK